jgi:hypothetical protein
VNGGGKKSRRDRQESDQETKEIEGEGRRKGGGQIVRLGRQRRRHTGERDRGRDRGQFIEWKRLRERDRGRDKGHDTERKRDRGSGREGKIRGETEEL